MSYSKYYVYKEQRSIDGGRTWNDTGNKAPSGTAIATYSTLAECEGYDYSTQYLTLKSYSTSNTVVFNNAPSTFYYSTDSGTTWSAATSATTIPLVTGGTWFKGDLIPTPNNGVGTFSANTQFTAEGNVMSLLYGDNFIGQTSLAGKTDSFNRLFYGCTSLTSAENLVLPATTLAEMCYFRMFSNCSSLTTAPQLPATTLAYHCYGSMFGNCDSLTAAPELIATTLAEKCYTGMFIGCTSLTTAPQLPATTLADYCYSAMFMGCTSLTTAPQLPATTLADYCYQSMFDGCTSLNYIKCLATNISATYCTSYWVSGVSSTGTFVKNSSMSSWTTGKSGIPSGWTVQDA